MTPTHDSINHPRHYTSSKAKCENCGHLVECIQVVEHLGFNIGNVVKYCWRFDLKDGLQDLKKAAWYLAREIARLEKEAGWERAVMQNTVLHAAQFQEGFETDGQAN